MSGPIVRTGTTPEFWKNWDNVFGKGAKSSEKAVKKSDSKAPKKVEKSAKKSAKKK